MFHASRITFLSVLIKLPFDQGFDFGDGLLGIRAAGVQGHFAAGTEGEHHQSHDAFAVDFFAVLFHENLGRKAVGSLDEQSGGPGVDAQLVGNCEFLGEKLAVRQFFWRSLCDSTAK